MLLYPAPIAMFAGGKFERNPRAVSLGNRDVLVVIADERGVPWMNRWQWSQWQWQGWNQIQTGAAGQPAIQATGAESALLMIRDEYGAYFALPLAGTAADGDWVSLGGVFRGDPVLAACDNRQLAAFGLDEFSGLWSARVDVAGRPLRPWSRLGGLAVQGVDLAFCHRNTAYVPALASGNQAGFLIVDEDSKFRWYGASFVAAKTPRLALWNGELWLILVDRDGTLQANRCPIDQPGRWSRWETLARGVAEATATRSAKELVIFFRGTDNGIRWWRSTDRQVRAALQHPIARGALAAAP